MTCSGERQLMEIRKNVQHFDNTRYLRSPTITAKNTTFINFKFRQQTAFVDFFSNIRNRLTVDVSNGVVCLTSMIIVRPRDRPRGLSNSGDVIVAALLQTQSSTLVFRWEAIRVTMTTTVKKAPTLAPDWLKVPDGVVVSTWARISLKLAYPAVCNR